MKNQFFITLRRHLVALMLYGIALMPHTAEAGTGSGYAYVTNGTADFVSKINLSTNLVESTISVGPNVIGIAITPDGQTAYGITYAAGGGDVITFDLLQPSGAVSILSNLGGLGGIALSPDGQTAYVTKESDGIVIRIDLLHPSAVPVVTGLNNPHGIAITPDGQTAYVTDSGDGTIIKFDLANPSVVPVVTGLNNPHGIAITPDGQTAYVTDSGDGTIIKIDLANPSVVPVVAGLNSPYGIAITSDGQTAYVTASMDGTVIKIDLLNPSVIQVVSGLNSPVGIALSMASAHKPKPPSRFRAHRVNSKHTVLLRWKKRHHQSAMQYKITRNKHKSFLIPASSRPVFKDRHVKKHKRYWYSIRTVDAAGQKSKRKWTHIGKS